MLSHTIRRRMDESLAREGAEGITGVQGRIIGFLCAMEGQDVFQRDVEREFHIRRSTATGILQLMERGGLIQKEPVPYDARLKKLRLTEKGLAAHRICFGQIQKLERHMQESLSEEEFSVLLTLLEKVQKSLDQYPAPGEKQSLKGGK